MMHSVRDRLVLEHMRSREGPMAIHADDVGLTSSQLHGALRSLHARGEIVRVRRKYGGQPTEWRLAP